MKCIVLLMVIGLSAGFSMAADTLPPNSPPSYMSYQGKLVQENGQPLESGGYDLEVRIYNGHEDSANLVWGPFKFDGQLSTVGHAAKAYVADGGRFNVILGDRDIDGDYLINALRINGAADRFIELKVGVSEPLKPRQQFLSAPYAFQAYQATRLPGVVNLPNGNVGIGTDEPAEKLDVNGNLLVHGDLAVQGHTSLSELTSSNILTDVLNTTTATVTAGLSAADFSVSNNADVGNDLNVGGKLTVTNLSAQNVSFSFTTESFATFPASDSNNVGDIALPEMFADNSFCALSHVYSYISLFEVEQWNRCQIYTTDVGSRKQWHLKAERLNNHSQSTCEVNCFKFQ